MIHYHPAFYVVAVKNPYAFGEQAHIHFMVGAVGFEPTTS